MEDYQIIKKRIRHNHLLSLVCSKKHLIQKIFQEQTGEKLNFNSPSFRTKLQLRKLSNNPLFTICADKNKVRAYVKNLIGEEYLIPQYFCKKRIKPSDLHNLPKSFILKTSSGSGFNAIITDKNNENLQEICKRFNKYTKIKYGYLWGEFFYNKINNQVIAEKLLTKNPVYDYKIHCFRDNNQHLRQIVEVLWGAKNNRHKNMYDTKWRPLDYYFSIPPDKLSIKKPKQLNELLELSAKLSKEFNYVRVDFYIINQKIYFGELTFIPTAGFGTFEPAKYDLIWGNWIGD